MHSFPVVESRSPERLQTLTRSHSHGHYPQPKAKPFRGLLFVFSDAEWISRGKKGSASEFCSWSTLKGNPYPKKMRRKKGTTGQQILCPEGSHSLSKSFGQTFPRPNLIDASWLFDCSLTTRVGRAHGAIALLADMARFCAMDDHCHRLGAHMPMGST